jgi:hypothetical protein
MSPIEIVENDWTPSIDGVVDSYKAWLAVKSPEHLRAFVERMKAEPQAARAEAVTFGVLRQQSLRPRPAEIVGKGGVDFLCEPEKKPPLAVEVTTLLIENVEKASGLPHPLSSNGGAIGFGQITTQLMREAVQKAGQMADYPTARVLILATEHSGASLLMNAHSASELVTGTTAFRVRIGDVKAEPEIVASLKSSVFFRMAKDTPEIEPARRSISAILLMSIDGEQAHVTGILHPDPVQALDVEAFPNVDFVRLRQWPIPVGGKFGIEWIGPAPSQTSMLHFPVGLQDADLR